MLLKTLVPLLLLIPFSLWSQKSPDRALQDLVAGNDRYVNDDLLHADTSANRREAIAAKQTPFAVILGCSDSRVPPEILFDQGLGDLFVVRVAGNVVAPVEIDSVDFATAALGASVVLVLGHESCGAVNAVLQGNTKDIQAVAELIEPGVAQSKSMQGNPLANAVKANVQNSVSMLKASPVLNKLIKQKKLKIVGGYYDLKTGHVDLLPQQ